jgi:hypothetical protein
MSSTIVATDVASFRPQFVITDLLTEKCSLGPSVQTAYAEAEGRQHLPE